MEKIKEELTNDKSSSEEEVDKEEEQKRLEQEMQKRRERIERWRAERKMKELESRKDSKPVVAVQHTSKKWSLEDESEDEGDKLNENHVELELPPPAPLPPIKIEADEDFVDKKIPMEVVEEKPVEVVDDDVDPLDAYMMEVANEVKKVNQISNPATSNDKGVVIVTGAKKKTEINKGELIEQNQDGLEYSSEEELDDIKDAVANLANKHKKELAKIDHSEMDYSAFKKNFYVEVPELAKMTQADVDAYRLELEGIHVKGKGCPKPIKVSSFCSIVKSDTSVTLQNA